MIAKVLFDARKKQIKRLPDQREEFITLQCIAIQTVADNFDLYPELENIPPRCQTEIIEKVNPELPITITAQNIKNENFWERAYDSKWSKKKLLKLEDHGNSYKRAFLEEYLEEYFENLEDDQSEDKIEEIKEFLQVSAFWVTSINLKSMKISLNIKRICKYLPLLTNLTLNFGIKYAGLNYQRQAFGIKLIESGNLGKAIEKHCGNLLSLSLIGNLIDDENLRFIMSGIYTNITLIDLNLSHNNIRDQGARRMAKYLMRNQILRSLSLQDNAIGYEGLKFISHSLKVNQKNNYYCYKINKSLLSLNVSLNNLDDKAGVRLFKDLIQNRILQNLDVAANNFDRGTAKRLADYLSDLQCPLKTINLSANNFGDDSYDMIKMDGCNKNMSLTSLLIRQCKFSKPEMEKEIEDIISKHYLKTQNIPFVNEYDFIDLKALKEKGQILVRKLIFLQLAIKEKEAEEIEKKKQER